MRNKSKSFFLTMEPSLQYETVKVRALVNVVYICPITHKRMIMKKGDCYDIPASEAMDDIRLRLVERATA